MREEDSALERVSEAKSRWKEEKSEMEGSSEEEREIRELVSRVRRLRRRKSEEDYG